MLYRSAGNQVTAASSQLPKARVRPDPRSIIDLHAVTADQPQFEAIRIKFADASGRLLSVRRETSATCLGIRKRCVKREIRIDGHHPNSLSVKLE